MTRPGRSSALNPLLHKELRAHQGTARIAPVASLPPLLKAHFLSPRHAGDPWGAQGLGRTENQACGDLLELGIWVAEGRIVQVRFRAEACSATLASASLVCTQLEGRTVAEARALDCEALVAGAGGVPASKGHAPKLVARALAAALEALRARYPGHAADPAPAERTSDS
jgi:NifU-like protein